jgi:geranylgeranyl diphosphate synthase type I
MAPDAQDLLIGLGRLRDRVDAVLHAFLDARRAEAVRIDPRAGEPYDEIAALLRAGGKRIRPAFCYWGFRAAGGPDGGPIVRAAAALELLHTMALIHDDVMDLGRTRRGVPALQVRGTEAASARGHADPERHGAAVAILVGDLAAVLADDLMLTSGFAPDRLAAALARYHRMRSETAAGQYLDLVHADVDVRRLAALKGGVYTVAGPLGIGAALADAEPMIDAALLAYGAPLGEAFQLRDDLRDGEAAEGIDDDVVRALVTSARDALTDASIDPDAVAALRGLADLVGVA